ncbi:OmpL47-type beta-barrel domain-containing protein [Cohnella hongkongensis]|uniref:OmpL47-type beta-barrel domain-containing protein n=1 Tax=Cohnella hongkongensis TaxID=178337 RepID=A0ABV9FHQ2_9BACL
MSASKKKWLVLLCMTAMLITSGYPGVTRKALAQEAEGPAVSLSVDAGTVVAPMSKEMRGTNIGLWTSGEFHPYSQRSERYVNLIKEAGISLIRFPAGHEADTIYWDRTNAYEWYQGPAPYVKTLTADMFDSYMAMLDEVGAEAMVTVNARIDNKEMAADMVRYANIEKGYQIKYWEIGNEPEYFEEGFKVTPEEYAQRIMEYADAMKAVDPSIVIVGPANGSSLLEEWVQPIMTTMQEQNRQLDAISVHWYPLAGNQTNPASSAYPSIENLLKYEGDNWQPSYINWIPKFTETTPVHNLVHYRDAYAPGALIGLTELGQVTSYGEGVADSHAGAVWLADVLPRLAYHKVDYVTQFLLQGDQTYSLMNMDKEIRPSYYVYPLIERYFGDQLLASSSSDNQNFTIWASKRTGADDKLYLMVVNKNQTQALDATIDLSGFNPRSTASVWVLNAPSVDALTGANINGVQVAEDGSLPDIEGSTMIGVSEPFTATYPAHSVTMIELTAKPESPASARYLGQYAAGMNERKAAGDYPGNQADTPDGYGKLWATGSASWTVNFPETGDYEMSVRAYGEGAAPSLQVKVDGQAVAGSSRTPSAAWENYAVSLGTIAAGKHVITIHNDSGAPGNNVDIASLVVVGAAPGAFTLAAPADQALTASTSVTLDWTQSIDGRLYAPFGADDYTLVVADNPSLTNPFLIKRVGGTTFPLHQLDFETEYYWQVYANNANGTTSSDGVFRFTTPEKPAEPVRFSGQYADGANERKSARDYPGNPADTPGGWGKIWATGTAGWMVNVPKTDSYAFTIRAYGEGETASFRVLVDGEPVPDAAWSAAGAWTDYQGSLGTLSEGTHIVSIHNTSAVPGNINLAYMDIDGPTPGSFSLRSPENGAAVGSADVTLDWTQVIDGKEYAPFGSEQYMITLAHNAELIDPVFQGTAQATFRYVNNLQYDTTYYWSVTAMNGNGSTVADDIFSFTTAAAPETLPAARYLGQYADLIQERKAAADIPGNVTDTPEGWGKIWRTGSGKWTVHFPVSGTYLYSIRAYGEGEAPSFQLKLDGPNVPGAAHNLTNAWEDYTGSLGYVSAGTHIVEINNNSAINFNNVDIAHIDIFGAAPGPFSLMSPADNATVAGDSTTLDWTQIVADRPFAPHGADEYTVILADNPGLLNALVNTTVTETTYEVSGLNSDTTYYWSVTAHHANGSTPAGAVFKFATTPEASDTEAPVTTVDMQGDLLGGWYRGDVTVALSGSDNGSGLDRIEYRLTENGEWQVYGQPLVWAEEGEHAIEYRSADLAGNLEDSKTLSFKIDKTAPTWFVTVNGEPLQDGAVLQESPTTALILQTEDAGSGVQFATLALDGDEYESGQLVDLSGRLGEHALAVEVVDYAGHRAQGAIAFTVEAEISIASLERWMDHYAETGELYGPLLNQLTQSLNIVKLHLGKGDSGQAAHHLRRYLNQLERPYNQTFITAEAKSTLAGIAEGLVRTWTEEQGNP